jgi:hypothetical protein
VAFQVKKFRNIMIFHRKLYISREFKDIEVMKYNEKMFWEYIRVFIGWVIIFMSLMLMYSMLSCKTVKYTKEVKIEAERRDCGYVE